MFLFEKVDKLTCSVGAASNCYVKEALYRCIL